MAGASKDLVRRIKSIQNIQQITKAMEMVAASKMVKAQEQAVVTRAYSHKALEILASIGDRVSYIKHPFLTKSEEKKGGVLICLVTSNKGLCGSFNTNTIKKMIEFKKDLDDQGVAKVDFVTIGKKGKDAVLRMKYSLIADYSDQLQEVYDSDDILPVSHLLKKEYMDGNYSRVYLIYTHFVSTLSQISLIKRIAPISQDIKSVFAQIDPDYNEEEESKGPVIPYNIEPADYEVIDSLLNILIDAQVFQMVVESSASEHSARMVAMKNATEAAGDLIEDLRLTYNKARQAAITQEIAEIVSGAEALNS
jgi:F-type H+-transporting ATPase subunit gamma